MNVLEMTATDMAQEIKKNIMNIRNSIIETFDEYEMMTYFPKLLENNSKLEEITSPTFWIHQQHKIATTRDGMKHEVLSNTMPDILRVIK